MKSYIRMILLTAVVCILLAACGRFRINIEINTAPPELEDVSVADEQSSDISIPSASGKIMPEGMKEEESTPPYVPQKSDPNGAIIIESEDGLVETGVKDGKLTFVDVYGKVHEVDYHEDWPLNDYNVSDFVMKKGGMTYESDEYTYRLGVDVYGSHGGIDWWAVEFTGYEFAIFRAGYRGYKYPNLVLDERVIENIEGALKYGLDVGVYFFSQAINEKEAVEEAEFVLAAFEENGIKPEDIKMGITFDPESIVGDNARTDNVTSEQFTANAIAFCERIEEAGYKSMIYSNLIWETEKFDLGQLSKYPIWYADYCEKPQTPYDFEIWQYGHGIVAGIFEQCDVNIQLIRKDQTKK